jgi:Holliday junction resolvasome RuvABC endonuclease subunit
MTTVIGIDPSLTATGLARLTLANTSGVRPVRIVETCVKRTTGHRNDSVTMRADRLVDIAIDVAGFALPCDLVVIEGPSLGSRFSGAAWDRAGLWWRIVGRLGPVAVVPPAVRARWATGNGRADKTQVRDAITQLWEHEVGDHNEADALVLASMGAQWLGRLPMDGPDPAVLNSAEWPDREAIAAKRSICALPA